MYRCLDEMSLGFF